MILMTKLVNWTPTLNKGRTMCLSKGLGNRSSKFSIVIEKLSKWNINRLWEIQVFPGSFDGKISPCNAGDLGLIPGSDPWVRKIPWRRKWQPTPVFLPGEFHAQRNLVGYSPWDHKETGQDRATNHIHTHMGCQDSYMPKIHCKWHHRDSSFLHLGDNLLDVRSNEPRLSWNPSYNISRKGD